MAELKLKELRLNAKLTQIELSKRLSINQVRYNHYEQNKNEPNIDTLIAIADLYGVSLDYLCNHTTHNQLDIGYLTEMQKATVLALKQLNESNLAETYGYINGLLVKQ